MRMPHEMAHEITPGGGPTRSNGSIAVSTHQQHQLLARGQGEAGGLGVCVLGRGVGCDAARHKPQLMFALDAAAVLGAAPHIVALQPHYTHQHLIVPDNAPPPLPYLAGRVHCVRSFCALSLRAHVLLAYRHLYNCVAQQAGAAVGSRAGKASNYAKHIPSSKLSRAPLPTATPLPP
jgi:hypothetical protein